MVMTHRYEVRLHEVLYFALMCNNGLSFTWNFMFGVARRDLIRSKLLSLFGKRSRLHPPSAS
jgi:hypothetical protein